MALLIFRWILSHSLEFSQLLKRVRMTNVFLRLIFSSSPCVQHCLPPPPGNSMLLIARNPRINGQKIVKHDARKTFGQIWSYALRVCARVYRMCTLAGPWEFWSRLYFWLAGARGGPVPAPYPPVAAAAAASQDQGHILFTPISSPACTHFPPCACGMTGLFKPASRLHLLLLYFISFLLTFFTPRLLTMTLAQAKPSMMLSASKISKQYENRCFALSCQLFPKLRSRFRFFLHDDETTKSVQFDLNQIVSLRTLRSARTFYPRVSGYESLRDELVVWLIRLLLRFLTSESRVELDELKFCHEFVKSSHER